MDCGLEKVGVWAKESPTFVRGNSGFGLRKLQEPEMHGKWAFSEIKRVYEFYLHAPKRLINLFLKIS